MVKTNSKEIRVLTDRVRKSTLLAESQFQDFLFSETTSHTKESLKVLYKKLEEAKEELHWAHMYADCYNGQYPEPAYVSDGMYVFPNGTLREW